jgi:putative oxidoreductase
MSPQQANASQPMIPALGALYAPLAPYSYAFMRFCVGAIIVPHGYTKLFQGAVGGAAGMIAKLGLEPSVGWAYFVGVASWPSAC